MCWRILACVVVVVACAGKSERGADLVAESGGGETSTSGGASSSGASAGGSSAVNASGGNPTAGRGGDLGGVTGAAAESGIAGAGPDPGTATSVVIDDGDRDGGNGLPPFPPSLGGSGFWWAGNRLGNWFVSSPAPDGYMRDAAPVEIVPPREDSVRGLRVQDTGRDRGVDLWAQLDHPSGRAVDLSAYLGIAFWARLEGSNGRLVVGMNPGVSYFESPEDVPSVELSVSSEWQRFELPFAMFDLDAASAASLDFIAGEGGGAFELWIDDVSLLCRSTCAP